MNILLSIKNYWISCLFCIIIFVLCFMDTAPLPAPPMPDFDKVVHLLMFLGLSLIVFFDNTRYLKKRISFRRIILASFLFPVLTSGLIEIMQEYLTSYRTGDWMDFLFDGIGSFLGLIACLKVNTWLK